MTSLPIDRIAVGDHAEFSKTLSESDVYLFAGITGDLNPAHVDEEYSRLTRFQTRIVHGMLLGGLISSVLAMKLPGPGTIYVSQELRFLAPVRIGDTVSARVEVVHVDVDKNRVSLRTTCSLADGTVVVDGAALVMPPKSRGAPTGAK